MQISIEWAYQILFSSLSLVFMTFFLPIWLCHCVNGAPDYCDRANQQCPSPPFIVPNKISLTSRLEQSAYPSLVLLVNGSQLNKFLHEI
ncbi:hypothetical protein VNO77_28120 [Canavalia gladiata]|uniref:Uncharacterized protein n=1 Tax=Canavalia gladiata TaxID=3824 RepID=A0AAN9QB27_CANGL